ncbi:MAG TPA: Crp/Fnr family transcriptional regulator [Pyrinomonadaceae bacterium]
MRRSRLLQPLKQLAIRNRILGALPDEELARIAPHLSPVKFEKDEIIYLSEDPIEFVYLPENGLISLLSTTETGSTIEVAMLGKEGVVGLPVILKNRIIPYDVKVRLRSDALKIKAEVFQEEFDKGQVLHEFVLRYLNVMITQISQSSICNRFHTIEATLSRWLLTVQDQTNSSTLYLTQQVISQALGVPRTGVTVAAGALQTDGAIRYSRGKIAILDRMRLESHSCECYRIIRDELDHFLNK